MNTKTIKFDLNKYKLYEKIKAKQGDTKSRFLLFQLLDGSIPFNLKNRSVRAYMIKPDGREIFNDLIVNNYNLGYCTLELTNQVLAAQGIVKIELMVTEGDKKLTSSVFELEVVKSINSEKSIVSTNEFTALLNGLAALSEYDNYKNSVKEMEINKANKAEVEEKFISVEEKIKNNSEQLDNIKNEIIKPKLKLGKVHIPEDLKVLPLNIYKVDDFNFQTDFKVANIFDFKNCTEIFIGNNTNGSNNGLSASSPISLKTFINNFKNGTYGGQKNFILTVIVPIFKNSDYAVFDNLDCNILLRSGSINNFTWCHSGYTNNIGYSSFTYENGVYKTTVTKASVTIVDVVNYVNTDNFGMPKPYRKVDKSSLLNERGSFSQEIIDGVNTIYINPYSEDKIENFNLVANIKLIDITIAPNRTFIMQNIGLNAYSYALRGSSITSYFYGVNCKYNRSPKNSFTIEGKFTSININSISSYPNLDCFAYTTTDRNSLGVEINCKGYGAGLYKYSNGEQNNWSNNGSTAHDGMKMLRIGCSYWDCEGGIVVDADDCYSITIGCKATNVLESCTGQKCGFRVYNTSGVTPINKKYFIECYSNGKNIEYDFMCTDDTYILDLQGGNKISGNPINLLGWGE